MEDKIGVYICTGYGIGEALDIEALAKVANDGCFWMKYTAHSIRIGVDHCGIIVGRQLDDGICFISSLVHEGCHQ